MEIKNDEQTIIKNLWNKPQNKCDYDLKIQKTLKNGDICGTEAKSSDRN